MTEDRRAILQRVASGELSPEAAADLLDQLGATTPPPPPPPPPPASGSTPPFEPLRSEPADGPREWPGDGPEPPRTTETGAPDRLETVRVVRSLGAARIVGDPTVVEAVAEGPHRAERLRHELVIHSDFEESGGFNFDHVQGNWGQYRNSRLNVRMRPDLALEVHTQGGSTQVQGVTGPISAEIQAGSLALDGVAAPLDVQVQAGSLSVSGLLDRGTSKIRCEAGSVKIVLRRGSSVRIVARTTLGHVSLPGLGRGRADEVMVGGGTREVTVGDGEALLEIESTMGSVRITEE